MGILFILFGKMKLIIQTIVVALPLAFAVSIPGSSEFTLIPRAASGESGFDISVAQSKSFFTCMRNNGYKKVAIRIYEQACGHGVSRFRL
jgi:hypothetical protein